MKKSLVMLLIATILLVSSLSAYGWLSKYVPQEMDVPAEIIIQYFDHGTGTEQDPYVITRPIHYYHLVELYQLKSDIFADEGVYYQIGYDMNNDGVPDVYNYDNSGNLLSGYSSTLNMGCYPELLPIGTSTVPFTGHYNGNNLTVSNLSIEQAGLCDVGVFGYVSENATITDAYFDNVTISVDGMVLYANDAASTTDAEHLAHTDNAAYVGYLVGHLQQAESVSNCYINHCQIIGSVNVDGVTNQYGYYGFCDNAKTIEAFVARAKGAGAGWGGSINMSDLYTRLYNIEGSATTSNNYVYDRTIVYNPDGTVKSNTATLTGTSYTYYNNPSAGSFVFSQARGQYLYLHGGTTITEQYLEYTGNTLTGYYIHNGNNYLSISGNSVTNTTRDNATLWEFPGGIGSSKIRATVNGTTYYLTSSLGLTTTANSGQTWTFTTSGTGYIISYTSTGLFARTYNIRYNNGSWSTNRNNSTVVTLESQTIQETAVNASRTRTYVDYTGTNNTYFPLLANSNNQVMDVNTGYVVSGSNDRTTSGTYPAKSGDIRVSRYSTSDISNSYSGGSLTTVYTFDLNNTQQTVGNNNSFVKYAASKAALLDTISGGNIYGLHFMAGQISIDNIVTASTVTIEKETYTNYPLPANSIDFLVLKSGYINFFAGTYFNNNNSFFSLHQIFRDDSNNITAIKEIAEIYSDGNAKHPYIYKYSDNTYSDTLTSDYSLIFTTAQIKRHNSLTQDAVYYFEIPVNGGEYALGSVDGGTGAYLMYLDIAANGGADAEGVDDFGAVEYRSAPDTAETSIILFVYDHPQNATISITTAYANNRYDITMTSTVAMTLEVALLSNDYRLFVNGTEYVGINIHTITIPAGV